MKLYICSVKELEDAASYDAASLIVDDLRKDKIDRIRNAEDKRRSLAAGLLLNYAVWKREIDGSLDICELTIEQLLSAPKVQYEYRTLENGKPYLEDCGEFHFSLSHSGEYVICACGNMPLGADIQQERGSVKDSLVKRVFSKREYQEFCNCKKESQAREFFRYWTIKESVVKLTGQGLSQDFRNMEIYEAERTVRISNVQTEVCYIEMQRIPGYQIAVSFWKV